MENRSAGSILKSIMLDRVPAYANKFYYSLGFLSATCFLMLLISGTILVVGGPTWWLTSQTGIYIRSIHLWSAQAFVLFILLHLLLVFLTYAYRSPRQFTWVLGGLMLFLVLIEAELGYGLRGDFSTQWRTLQAADLYNGSGLGVLINNLNYAQIYGIHIALIPILLISLLAFHYLLVKARGIALPHRRDIHYRVVRANHLLLFSRGIILVIVILVLATLFRSPLIAPVTIQDIAKQDPSLMAQTLVAEFARSSDTATYEDNIDPYTYDTRSVYVIHPYQQLMQTQTAASPDEITAFLAEPPSVQAAQLAAAKTQYASGNVDTATTPVTLIVRDLVQMAASGLYEADLRSQSANGFNPTYVARFLSDTGVLDQQAESLGITTEQYGMIREETGVLPPGAWWLAPIGVLDNTVLVNDPKQDQHGAEIIGLAMLLFLAFPYIPYLNRIPDKLSIYRLIWRERDPAARP